MKRLGYGFSDCVSEESKRAKEPYFELYMKRSNDELRTASFIGVSEVPMILTGEGDVSLISGTNEV